MRNAIVLILLFGASVFGAEKFELKNASQNYDVKIVVEKCENGFCAGAATFTLIKKGETKPFQTFEMADTSLWLNQAGEAQANVTLLYDEQSAVNFGDFNFDSREDIAICDGKNGGYGAPSYQVYLFDAARQRFVNNAALSNLAQGEYLGMFQMDAKRKVLQTAAKSGCCWHQSREFRVVGNRPQKVLEITEDAQGGENVIITTKRLIGKRWKTTVRREKIKEPN